MNYNDFVKNKLKPQQIVNRLNHKIESTKLFDFQKDIVELALAKGKFCCFSGTGTGKTFLQITWANSICNQTNKKVLIVAPLAVSFQTKEEAKKLNINIKICRNQHDVESGINITNYEMLDHFNENEFIGVVLDESSIIKHHEGKLRNYIIDKFKNIPYKFACTATPSPNDYMELGNHCELMGVMTREEMLASFFTHDSKNTSKWRIKGHAQKKFWQWMSNWAIMFQHPHDLGYTGHDRFNLPKLNFHEIITETKGLNLFKILKKTSLENQHKIRTETTKDRAEKLKEIVNNSDEQFIIWCGLNSESEYLKKVLNDSIEVKGSDDREYKIDMYNRFVQGKERVMITKSSIFGMGLNIQNCHKMSFFGTNYSFEGYYQAVRRCWRFGQKNEVDVYMVVSDRERHILKSIKEKERRFEEMLKGMIAETQELSKRNLQQTKTEVTEYEPQEEFELPEFV